MIQEARDTIGSSFDRMTSGARARPEALLLIAAGCALLMLGKRGDESDERGSRYDESGDEWRGRVTNVAGSYVEGLQSYGSQMGSRLAETSGQLGAQARHSIDAGVDVLSDQPLLLAALGVAAGIAAAAIIPRSQIEDEALETVRERVEDFGEETGQHIADAAERASDTLAREVRERGLDREGLKDVASKVANSVTEAMAGHPPHQGRDEPGKSSGQPSAQSGGSRTSQPNENPAKS